MAQMESYTSYWLRYQHQFIFSPIISWSNEIDNRRFISPDVQNQLIYHSRVHYKRGPWDYAAGLTLSWAFASRPSRPVTHATTEVRPMVEVSYEIPKNRWALQQRIRIDNRFIEEDRMETVFDGVDYTLRLRYRLQARFNLKKETGSNGPVFRIADEIMVNHRENFFDQNRIYATVDFQIRRNWRLETGYIFIHQQRFSTNDFFDRNVLRFSVLHSMRPQK